MQVLLNDVWNLISNLIYVFLITPRGRSNMYKSINSFVSYNFMFRVFWSLIRTRYELKSCIQSQTPNKMTRNFSFTCYVHDPIRKQT